MPALCTVKVGGCLHWVDRPRQWRKLSLPDPDLESLEWSVCIETNGYKSHPEEPHSCTGWCWCGPVQSCVDSSCTNWECVPSELCTCLCTHTYTYTCIVYVCGQCGCLMRWGTGTCVCTGCVCCNWWSGAWPSLKWPLAECETHTTSSLAAPSSAIVYFIHALETTLLC